MLSDPLLGGTSAFNILIEKMSIAEKILPRSLPPSGVPITVGDICAAIRGLFSKDIPLERFREEVCRYFDVKHAFFSSSGRASLAQLFKTMAKLRPGKDLVLLPAYTSFSVPSAVVKAGLKVALYDVDPETLSPDIDTLKDAVSSSTLCVVVCHLYGYPCDMDAVREALKGSDVYLVDDAAQAMGARYKGAWVGTLGDAGLFSFSRGKNITTVDGGVVVTDRPELAAAICEDDLQPISALKQWILILKALILSWLLNPYFYWIPQKIPFLKLGMSVFEPQFPLQRFTGAQAAIGSRMLRRLEKINHGRCEVAHKYRDGGEEVFKTIKGAEPVFLRYPIRIENQRPLDEPALGLVASYPAPLNEVNALKPHAVLTGSYPGATRLASSMRTMPTHSHVTERDVAMLLKIIQA